MMNKNIKKVLMIISVIVMSSCNNNHAYDIENETTESLTGTPALSLTDSPSETIVSTVQPLTPTTYPTATLSGEDMIHIDCERTIYNVIEGDTLTIVSEMFAVPIDEIKNYNGFVDDFLYEGQILVLPLCDWDYIYELLGKED